MTRPAKVEALNSCSAYRLSDTCIAFTHEAGAGAQLVLYPLSAFRAMSKAAEIVYGALRQEGTQQSVLDRMQTRVELYEVLGYHEYEQKLDELFVREGAVK